ncbi:leucyl-tRNA synthetase, mitochondrial precursor [Histoplasma mississippiense (nom. inval.)]|uniref:leucyl-tRNA synthetase, mitochondrial precursor n=1 Tax=Ajellomyces capsulatus (strain NAm1 / WU24) TaxID=2059318 RepID=UPI000157C977|nr:leucyl-tRNA synthetase, mitochondrial precursor [Histoplasma mississippiense (nom. inval.)]EDN09674.1 leucyl-tRNA synthetase, mitochondrial precursor [Histoplasma mississippiense (nom. inval.)]
MNLRQSILTQQWGRCLPFRRRGGTAIRAASTTPRRIDLLAVDKKWKEKWRNDPSSELVNNHGKEKAYVLSMFPYPSGALHLGHVRVYTISDVLARFKHMKGYDVLHPMGWDAFGLPAENAAIERGIDPAKWTMQNIANMKEQLRAIGARFDWDRELMTCSPEFYKHTQRIFLMLYKEGLAYQAKARVNYDPIDKTVLANEQVDANGCSWRSGAKVEKLELKQWFFRITAFKEALLKDLESLEASWPERVLSMQRHWLGKSSGAHIKFLVSAPDDNYDIQVFTTRPDTLHGVQYLGLSTTHPLVAKMARSDPKLKSFLDSATSLPQDTKAGYLLPGVVAVNPLSSVEANPSLQASIPVYVAPYVLGEYGEGAVMGVPGHDSRDFAFWNENSKSKQVTFVVKQILSQEAEPGDLPEAQRVPFLGHGILADTCGSYSGMSSEEGGKKIIEDLKSKGDFANVAESWRLRDWLVSRQRYWGTPIPIIHCDSCGPVPVPQDHLPVELPVIEGDSLRGSQGNPLEYAEEWLHVPCPSCGKAARRDTDTMDTFVDSSWYFLRFLDPANKTAPFSPSHVHPVDIYIGGIEHAILHLLYAREVLEWDESKIVGMERWFNRLWRVVLDSRVSLQDLSTVSDDEATILLAAHDTITSVSRCLDGMPYGLNTVISDLTKFTNSLASSSLPTTPSPSSQAILYIALSSLLRLLAPITPALASECWEHLHSPIRNSSTISSPPRTVPSIFSSPWPDPLLSSRDVQSLRARVGKTVAVQINGKLRFSTTIPSLPSGDSVSTKTSDDEQSWILFHLLETSEGKLWLKERHDWEKRKRVIVARGGKVVNVVF